MLCTDGVFVVSQKVINLTVCLAPRSFTPPVRSFYTTVVSSLFIQRRWATKASELLTAALLMRLRSPLPKQNEQAYGPFGGEKCAAIVNIKIVGDPLCSQTSPGMRRDGLRKYTLPSPPPPVLPWPCIKVITHPPLSCYSHALTTTPPQGFLSVCVCLFVSAYLCVCVCVFVHMLMSTPFYANACILA